MTHIKSFCSALKITWVKRVLDNQNNGMWRKKIQWQMKPYGEEFVFEGNFQSHDTVSFHVNCFWRDVLIAWSFYKYYNPVKLKEIVSQSIWNNSFIKIDGQIIFFRRWFDQGVKYITDILTENGNFKLFIDMQSEFNLNGNQFMRYYAIVCAIKSKWKNIFSQGNLNYPCDDHKL